MNYTVEKSSLLKKLEELEIEIPVSLTFLPENIIEVKDKSEFIFADSTIDFKKILRLNNIESIELKNDSLVYRNRKSADLYGPAIFISLSILTENQYLISIALNIISDYCTDWFKGTYGQKKVKLDIYVETKKNKTVKKILYEGDSNGIKELEKVIKSLK